MNLAALFQKPAAENRDFIRTLFQLYPDLRMLLVVQETTTEGTARPEQSFTRFFSNTELGVADSQQVNPTEFDRTLVALVCLRQVLQDDYEGFVAAQPPARQMTRAQFTALRQFVFAYVGNPPQELPLQELVTFLIINDLGKTQQFKDAYAALGHNRHHDHDRILAVLLHQSPELAAAYAALPAESRARIMAGLATNYNLGHLVHGENAEGNAARLQAIDPRARHLFLLHGIFDMAGAQGHVKPNGSETMNRPWFERVWLAVQLLMDTQKPPVVATYLTRSYAGTAAAPPATGDLILPRLAALCRLDSTPQQGIAPADRDRLQAAWQALSPADQEAIRRAWARDGISEKPFILLTHIPAVIANSTRILLAEAGSDPAAQEQARRDALVLSLRTVANIYRDAEATIAAQPQAWRATACITINLFTVASRANNGAAVQQARQEQRGLAELQLQLQPGSDFGTITHGSGGGAMAAAPAEPSRLEFVVRLYRSLWQHTAAT